MTNSSNIRKPNPAAERSADSGQGQSITPLALGWHGDRFYNVIDLSDGREEQSRLDGNFLFAARRVVFEEVLAENSGDPTTSIS